MKTQATSIVDSRIFGDMFSDAAIRLVWSDENRTAKYLDIERALAKVQGGLGIIPKEAADEIVKHCALKDIDWDKLKAKTGKPKSPRSSSPSRPGVARHQRCRKSATRFPASAFTPIFRWCGSSRRH